MFSRLVPSLMLLSLGLACGGPLTYDVPSMPVAPGADAHIEADVLKQQNQTQLEIEIENLAPPSRVDADSKHYVSWYRADSHAIWARIAGIDYDADERQGRVIGSVPLTRFELEITAEADASAESPSQHVVFNRAIGEE